MIVLHQVNENEIEQIALREIKLRALSRVLFAIFCHGPSQREIFLTMNHCEIQDEYYVEC